MQQIIITTTCTDRPKLASVTFTGTDNNSSPSTDHFTQGIQMLAEAYRLEVSGKYNNALIVISDAIELLEAYSSNSQIYEQHQDHNQKARLAAVEKNLQRANLGKERINNAICCQITIMARVFGLRRLESDENECVNARAQAFAVLGIQDGDKRAILESSKELLRTEVELEGRLGEYDVFPEGFGEVLVSKGFRTPHEKYRGESVKQWIEDIQQKLANGEDKSLLPVGEKADGDKPTEDDVPKQNIIRMNGLERLVEKSHSDTKVLVYKLTQDGVIKDPDQINVIFLIASDAKVADLVKQSKHQSLDEKIVAVLEGCKFDTKLPVSDAVICLSTYVSSGSNMPFNEWIIRNSPNPTLDPDEIRLTLNHLVHKALGDSEINDEERDLLITLISDYPRFFTSQGLDSEKPVKTQEKLTVITAKLEDRYLGLRCRMVQFFKGRESSSLSISPSPPITNIGNAFDIDPKCIQAYITESETKPAADKRDNSEDIELARVEVRSSINNEGRTSTLVSAQTPQSFCASIKEVIGAIDISLEQLGLRDVDLYIAKCYWILRKSNERVDSSELLTITNTHLKAAKIEEITLPELNESLDKLYTFSLETEATGIFDDALLSEYKKLIQEEPVCTYQEFLSELKLKFPSQSNSVETMLEQKLRLTAIDYCLINACKLLSQRERETGFDQVFNELLTANNVHFEYKQEDQEHIAAVVRKINRVLGDLIKVTYSEEIERTTVGTTS